MRYVYLDSSALVKAYAPESGSERVRNLIRSTRAVPPTARVIVCDLAYPEIVSAIRRKEAQKDLTRNVAARLCLRAQRDFQSDVRPYELVEPSADLYVHAAALITVHQLRTNDSLHLAAALAARAATPEGVLFLFGAADRDLEEAARAENFEIFEIPKGVPAGGN